MRSAVRMVDSRWAMISVVRSRRTLAIAAATSCSLSVSRLETASSMMRIGASLRMARAMAMRWRWPPERRAPSSPGSVS